MSAFDTVPYRNNSAFELNPMTDLTQYRIGDRVTFANSTAIMIIEHFKQEHRGQWHATVRFACDHRRTQMDFPVNMLFPISATDERTIQ